MSGTRQAVFYTSCGGISPVAPVSAPPVASSIHDSRHGPPGAMPRAVLRKQMVTPLWTRRDVESAATTHVGLERETRCQLATRCLGSTRSDAAALLLDQVRVAHGDMDGGQRVADEIQTLRRPPRDGP